MNTKTVDELVEWVVQKCYSADLDLETSRWLARQILSHPDLCLRVVEGRGDFRDSDEVCTMHYEYIPLAEALAPEVKERSRHGR